MNFHDNGIPAESFPCIFLSVTWIDCVFIIVRNYHPHIFLEECKYIVKRRKDKWIYQWGFRNFFW